MCVQGGEATSSVKLTYPGQTVYTTGRDERDAENSHLSLVVPDVRGSFVFEEIGSALVPTPGRRKMQRRKTPSRAEV